MREEMQTHIFVDQLYPPFEQKDKQYYWFMYTGKPSEFCKYFSVRFHDFPRLNFSWLRHVPFLPSSTCILHKLFLIKRYIQKVRSENLFRYLDCIKNYFSLFHFSLTDRLMKRWRLKNIYFYRIRILNKF